MTNIYGNYTPSHTEPEELMSCIGKEVLIHGIVYRIRHMSGFAFVILRTKRHLVQCVHSADFSEFEIGDIRENAGVVFSGIVVHDERSKTGCELRLRSVEVISWPAAEPPVVINQKEVRASLETLLDFRPITLRNARERAVFKLQEGLCRGFRDFLTREKFTEIHSPKIVFSGAEGGANIFTLDYFGREAFLAQSPQFYKQIMVGVFERVFEIAPVYRAEKHDTSRHINEYTSVDLEIGFIRNFVDICRLETAMISGALEFITEYYRDELELLKVDIPVIAGVPSLRFDEAKELVSKTYRRDITDYEDFDPEEEKLLSDIVKKETGSDFVFVTHYRSSVRPFYAQDDKDDPVYTNTFDLLFRGVEVTTGGQRIHDYHEQVDKMKARGMDVNAFSSYLMAHKHGLPPHGGLGFGLERFTARLLGFNNVRYATLFPRDINRLEP